MVNRYFGIVILLFNQSKNCYCNHKYFIFWKQNIFKNAYCMNPILWAIMVPWDTPFWKNLTQ